MPWLKITLRSCILAALDHRQFPGRAGRPGRSPTFYLLAIGKGTVAGLVLASVQWLALREWVDRAWLWLPANAAAWMVGMPLIFVGASFLTEGASVMQNAVPVPMAIIASAMIVGAIQGAVLVWLLRSRTEAAFT